MVDLGEDCRALSWAPHRPGFQSARRVVWREVRNADLTPDVDPVALLRRGLEAIGALDAIGLMTSRDIRRHFTAFAEVEGVAAACLATTGLGNGERVGRRRHARPPGPGTVNMLVHVSQALDDAALLEAQSVAAQARTLAIIEGDYRPDPALPPITGTGTDCIVLTCRASGPRASYAGLHTAVGEAIGAAVLAATRAGVADWLAERALDKSGAAAV